MSPVVYTDTEIPTAWVPTDQSGAALSITVNGASYIKTGRLVVASLNVTYPTTADASQAKLSIPFAADAATGPGNASVGFNTLAIQQFWRVTAGGSVIVGTTNSSASLTNANLSGATVILMITYFSAN